jgi:hypothetical protein
MLRKTWLHISLFILCIIPYNAFANDDFCITANYGPGYRLMTLKDSSTESFESYFKKKKPGTTLDFQAIWYSDNHGIGVGFKSFFNSVSGENIEIPTRERVNMSDRIRINFFSLQYHNRFYYNDSRLWGDLGFGLGLVRYRDEGKFFETNVLTTGKTYGLDASLSCNYDVSRRLAFGISAGFFTAVLSEWIKDGNLEKLEPKEGLTRLELTGGIKIFF